MGETKMTAYDFNLFSNMLAQFYTPFFGTPAAEAAKNIFFKIRKVIEYEVDEFPGNEVNYEELPNGKYLVKLGQNDKITEKRLYDSGLDADINDAIETLRQGVNDGLYPEGALQRTLVDFMIDDFEHIQSRDLCKDIDRNELYGEMPGASMTDKIANYTLVPKLYEKKVNPVSGAEEIFSQKDLPKMESIIILNLCQEMIRCILPSILWMNYRKLQIK